MPLKPFLETLYNIEEAITSQLMQRGGFMKILFEGGDGRWFTLASRSDKVSYQYVPNGPWNYFNEVFPEKNKIYAGSRIISPNRPKSLQEFISKLQSGLQICSKAFPEDGFGSLNGTDSAWSLFAVPFENRTENKAARLLFETHAKKKGFNLLKLYKYSVRRFVIISLVLTEEGKGKQQHQEESSKNLSKLRTL